MSPRSPRLTTPADNMERLVRLETLLETVAERQNDQHEENRRATAKAEQATREHRHATANAMSDVRGRLGEIKAVQTRQAEQIADIAGVTRVAAQERKGLDERLKTLEAIATLVKGQWRLGGALFGLVAAIAASVAGCIKAVDAVTGWLHR